MSLSRSPSPVPGGGWQSPGLNFSGRSSPAHVQGGTVSWESTKMRNHGVNGYPSFATQNSGFFQRHMRRISSSLPRFNSSPYAHKEKQDRGGWAGPDAPFHARVRNIFGRMGRKMKFRLAIVAFIILLVCAFYFTRKCCLPRGAATYS